jgi:hypothetical protein
VNFSAVPVVRSVVLRYGLTLAMLTLVGVGCLGGSTAIPSSQRPGSGSQPPGVAPATVDVLVRVQSSHPSHQFGIKVRCPGDNALPAWYQACRAIAEDPRLFTNTHDPKGCIGGLATVLVHVTGMIDGRRIDIQQSDQCGPLGATAWYPLLRHHAPMRLPAWFRGR